MPIFILPSQSIRWLFAELSIVVIGILIAFQIEEWRTDLGDRELERVLLENMQRDIDAELAMLDQYSEFIKLNAESTIRLIELIDTGTASDPESVTEIWLDAINEFRWRKTSPTYNGWRDSGRPDLIRDAELRGRLRGYHEQYLSFLEEASTRYQDARLQVTLDSYEDFSYPWRWREDSGNFTGQPRPVHPMSDFPRSKEFLISLKQYASRASQLYNEINRGINVTTDHRALISNYLETYYN